MSHWPVRIASIALVASTLGCGWPMEPSRPAIYRFSLGADTHAGFGYLVTFTMDGEARDIRSADLLPNVECVGRVSLAAYDAVARVIETEGFFALGAQYGPGNSSAITVVTSALRDGNAKNVRSHPGTEPASLARVQEAISDLRQATSWTAVSGRPLDQKFCRISYFSEVAR